MKVLRRAGERLDAINRTIGSGARWLALAMLLVQFGVVVLRYVFGSSYIAFQEAVIYLHAALFMLCIGYTLLLDGHVRVDVFYSEMSARRRAAIDFFGSILFLIPTCLALLWFTWRFAANSWAIREGAMSVGGIPAVFVLKSLVPLMAVLLLIQGISLALRALADLLEPPGR